MVRNLGASSVFTRSRLRFRARLSDCWISAVVTSAQPRIGDVLNAEMSQGTVVLAEDLCVTRDARDAETRGEVGTLNLGLVQLVVPVEEGANTGANSFEYVRKRPNLIRVGVDGYEIVGDFNLAEGQGLREVLVRPNPPFLPLTSARLEHLATGRTETHRVVFVNRRLAAYIIPEA